VQKLQPVITAGGQLVNTTRQRVQQGQQAFSNQPTAVLPQPARPGMSNTAKIGIAVAVVAIVGGTIYFATKK